MKFQISATEAQLGAGADGLGARLIRQAIKQNGKANTTVANGASQFEMLECTDQFSKD